MVTALYKSHFLKNKQYPGDSTGIEKFVTNPEENKTQIIIKPENKTKHGLCQSDFFRIWNLKVLDKSLHRICILFF
jgi:hypothetical protein